MNNKFSFLTNIFLNFIFEFQNYMDNVSDWQHPFVDVFKRYNTFDAPKSYKGSVSIVHVITRIKLGSCDC